MDLLVVWSLEEGVTRTVVQETEPAEKVWLRSLVWTPDGEHVLFVKSLEEGAAELWRVNPDSQELTSLELKMNGLGDLSIHPDGLQLGFQAGYNKSDVWVMEGFLPAVQTTNSTLTILDLRPVDSDLPLRLPSPRV